MTTAQLFTDFLHNYIPKYYTTSHSVSATVELLFVYLAYFFISPLQDGYANSIPNENLQALLMQDFK